MAVESRSPVTFSSCALTGLTAGGLYLMSRGCLTAPVTRWALEKASGYAFARAAKALFTKIYDPNPDWNRLRSLGDREHTDSIAILFNRLLQYLAEDPSVSTGLYAANFFADEVVWPDLHNCNKMVVSFCLATTLPEEMRMLTIFNKVSGVFYLMQILESWRPQPTGKLGAVSLLLGGVGYLNKATWCKAAFTVGVGFIAHKVYSTGLDFLQFLKERQQGLEQPQRGVEQIIANLEQPQRGVEQIIANLERFSRADRG